MLDTTHHILMYHMDYVWYVHTHTSLYISDRTGVAWLSSSEQFNSPFYWYHSGGNGGTITFPDNL